MNSTACDDVIVTEVSVETNPVSSLPLRHWFTCWAVVVVYKMVNAFVAIMEFNLYVGPPMHRSM